MAHRNFETLKHAQEYAKFRPSFVMGPMPIILEVLEKNVRTNYKTNNEKTEICENGVLSINLYI